MCGRFVTIIPYEELKAIYDLVESNLRIRPRFNVAPTQQVGVIRCCDEGNHNWLDFLKWGLIPSWSKDAKIASHTINARSETIAEKPAFRHAIKYKRCIVPVSGFYEWSHTDTAKRPYFIHLADKAPITYEQARKAYEKGNKSSESRPNSRKYTSSPALSPSTSSP